MRRISFHPLLLLVLGSIVTRSLWLMQLKGQHGLIFLAAVPAHIRCQKAKMPYYTSVIPTLIRKISIGKAQLLIWKASERTRQEAKNGREAQAQTGAGAGAGKSSCSGNRSKIAWERVLICSNRNTGLARASIRGALIMSFDHSTSSCSGRTVTYWFRSWRACRTMNEINLFRGSLAGLVDFKSSRQAFMSEPC